MKARIAVLLLHSRFPVLVFTFAGAAA